MPSMPRNQGGEKKPRFVFTIFPSLRKITSALLIRRHLTKDIVVAAKTSDLQAVVAVSNIVLSQYAKDEIKPEGAFTIFQNLPAELRIKIWALALSEPQVITLAVAKSSIPAIMNPKLHVNEEYPTHFYGRPSNYSLSFPYRTESEQALDHARLHTASSNMITTLLHVNRESRSEVLKSYNPCRILDRGTRVYINPSKDTLFINSSEAYELTRRAVIEIEKAKTLQLNPGAAFSKFRFLAVKFGTLLGPGVGTMNRISPYNLILVHWFKRVVMIFGCLEEVFIVKAWEGTGEEAGFAQVVEEVLEIQMDDEVRRSRGSPEKLITWNLPKISVVGEEEMREKTRVRRGLVD